MFNKSLHNQSKPPLWCFIWLRQFYSHRYVNKGSKTHLQKEAVPSNNDSKDGFFYRYLWYP